MKTVEILGKTYPVMAALGTGYFLIAHPNGPAIGCPQLESLTSIFYFGGDAPDSVVSKAQDAVLGFILSHPNYPKMP